MAIDPYSDGQGPAAAEDDESVAAEDEGLDDESLEVEGLEDEEFEEEEEFSEIIRYTGAGFVGGLVLGAVLDALGFQGSAVGQWLVRTLAGEGESILEGYFSLRKRLGGGAESMAQAYGFGKLAGMALPWVVDWGSRALGVDVNAAGGFY
ncbi:MAG: hypothetical protein R6X16_15650, partial [Anaerolineae bacterium]